MKPLCLLAALALPLAIAGFAHAGAKKQPPISIRFYPEMDADEGGEFTSQVPLLNGKRTANMGQIPLLNEKDITGYSPFQAQDGSGTFGAYFKLDDHGTNLLSQHTMSARGTYVLVFFNGRHLVDELVDKPVTDGIAVIPSGLTQGDIALIDMAIPLLGQSKSDSSRKKGSPPVTGKSTPAPLKPSEMPRMSQAMARQPDGTYAPAQAQQNPGLPEMPVPMTSAGQPMGH